MSQQYSYESDNKENIDVENQEDDQRKYETKQRKRQKKVYVGSSFRFLVFVITLWIVCLASLILGFILHFDMNTAVTFSSILWTFSFIIFVIASAYSYFYYKLKHTNDNESKIMYSKFFPV